jgi:hypothetical protein
MLLAMLCYVWAAMRRRAAAARLVSHPVVDGDDGDNGDNGDAATLRAP